jgi:predicted phage terminase large subunit-like protein
MEDLTILGKLELALEREIYRDSYYEFYKAAFCQLHPGEEYDENWHAKYICDILQEETERVIARRPREKDIIINVPPRSSKSMICTVIWPVWCWTKYPAMKFLTCSYSDIIATNLSRLSKDLIQSNWFQRLYGDTIKLRGDLSGAGHFANTATGFRYAFGLDGTVTGMGGDFIVADDIQNPKKANSEVERESTIMRWNETISNRLNQLEIGGRIIVMQRLHEMDIAGYLLDPRKGRPDSIRHIRIPAEYDVKLVQPAELKEHYHDGKLFWKTRFPEKELANEKKKGTLYYVGQFQQTPIPPEGNLFKRSWIEIIDPMMISRDNSKSPLMFFIDTAYTEDETERNDPSGILTCFRKDNFLYVVNFVQVWMEFPKLLKFLKEYIVVNGYTSYSAVYIEPKASGKSVAQQMRAETQLNIIEIDSDFIKDDKVTRATGVSPMVEARRMKVVAGDWNDLYISELAAFPKAAHDEAVDTTVYALNILFPTKGFFAEFVEL